jgi:hypothetical protein
MLTRDSLIIDSNGVLMGALIFTTRTIRYTGSEEEGVMKTSFAMAEVIRQAGIHWHELLRRSFGENVMCSGCCHRVAESLYTVSQRPPAFKSTIPSALPRT